MYCVGSVEIQIEIKNIGVLAIYGIRGEVNKRFAEHKDPSSKKRKTKKKIEGPSLETLDFAFPLYLDLQRKEILNIKYERTHHDVTL